MPTGGQHAVRSQSVIPSSPPLHETGTGPIVISQIPHRKTPLAIDLEVYKWRHLIENFFGKLKEFERIAMRSDRTDQSFAAMIHLAAAVIASKCEFRGKADSDSDARRTVLPTEAGQ